MLKKKMIKMSLKILYEYDKKKVKMKFKKSYAQFNVKLVLFTLFIQNNLLHKLPISIT